MNTLVLSDLHLGNGGAYDIFAGEAELPALLATFVGKQVHVVLNGDTFDFLLNDQALALRPALADEQAKALLNHPGTRSVVETLGKVAKAGGQVTFRSGNHDLELGLPSVQALVLKTMGNPSTGVAFSTDKDPLIVKTAAGDVVIAHGEYEDDWNRFVHADVRPDNDEFRYPPGSKLVKAILNRMKREHGMRFADLLKPDFSGAVLTALAVKPSAVAELGQTDTAKLVFQLVRRKTGNPDALVQPGAQQLAPAPALELAGLTDEEQAALEDLVEGVDQPEGFLGEPLLRSALQKVGTAALKTYAAAHRWIAGDGSAKYFSLAPGTDEWEGAVALGAKHQAKFVVSGHTHSARWATDGQLSYVNTGTWIHLMRLPSQTANAREWTDFLELLKKDPGLTGAAEERLERHFTFALIDENKGPELLVWAGDKAIALKPCTMQ